MKSEKVYLFHIRDSISHILSYTEGLDENSFLKNVLVQDAVIRNFEIIGEATKRLSKEFRSNHSEVPWSRMAGMRDKLIHDYIQVDLQRVWNVVTDVLPGLQKDILSILNKI